MFGIGERKQQRKQEKLEKERAAKAAAEEALSELVAADEWLSSLDAEEKGRLFSTLTRMGRFLMSVSLKKRTMALFIFLAVLLSTSAAFLYVDSAWSAVGLIPLFWSWLLFKGFEKRSDLGISCVDPLSAVIVVKMYRDASGVSGEGVFLSKGNIGPEE